MPPLRDLTGQKFGHLTVIKRAPNKGKKVAWECLCDCGNTTIVAGNNLTRKEYRTTTCGCRTGRKIIGEQHGELTIIEDLGIQDSRHRCKCQCSCGKILTVRYGNLISGDTTSCGDRVAHRVRSNWNDLTGQKFGKLTVIQETDKRIDNKIVWRCQCECGNTVDVISTNLRKGNTLSCGCYHKEVITNDISNKRFGKLVAIEPTEDRSGSSVIWKCQCDCGTICYKSASMLVTGGVKSCGCLISYGEEKIRNILNEHQILFKTQKAFESCRFDDTGALARFDFYIDEKYLIEFDGIQHFEYKNSGWDTEEHFKKTQKHDEYKNQWCKDNNIPLIRIPYTKLDTLCIEDLMLETTQFRVV